MTARRNPKTVRSYDPRHRRDVGAPVRIIGGGTERTRLTSRERRRLLREARRDWMEGRDFERDYLAEAIGRAGGAIADHVRRAVWGGS